MITKEQLIRLILQNAIIVIVASFLSGGVIWYSIQQMRHIGHSIAEKKRVSLMLEKRSETYARLQTDNTLLSNADVRIKAALVPTEDISDFISALETLGVQTGVQQTHHFGVPVLSNDKNGMSIATIDYSLGIQANGYTLISYLKNFEQLPYFSGISSIIVNSNTTKGLNEVSSVSLGAVLYTRQN